MRRLADLQERAVTSMVDIDRIADAISKRVEKMDDAEMIADQVFAEFGPMIGRTTIDWDRVDREAKKRFRAVSPHAGLGTLSAAVDALERMDDEQGPLGERLSERAASKAADPEWMTKALKVADIYNDVMESLGLTSRPEGKDREAVDAAFMKALGKAGFRKGKVPIEVYYELEDSNYHTANEIMDRAGFFDARYGERQAEWEKEGEGIDPMWKR